MKTIALTLFAAALGLAQSSPSTTATPAKEAAKAAPAVQSKKVAPSAKASTDPKATGQKAKAQPVAQTIPAGARLVEPNLYQYTDSSGKTWNYRQTPFGISKWEETPGAAQPATPPAATPSTQTKPDPVVVTDLGDSYRFERKTPFGASIWVRKKSDLNNEEKGLAAGQLPQSDSKQTSANSKSVGN